MIFSNTIKTCDNCEMIYFEDKKRKKVNKQQQIEKTNERTNEKKTQFTIDSQIVNETKMYRISQQK